MVVHGEADAPYRAERVAPFITHAVDCLGWDRVIFGSNWPVATAVVAYGDWVAMLTEILRSHGASEVQLEAVFGASARALYRLGAEK